MFRRQNNNNNANTSGQTGSAAIERVTSVLGPGINWRGSLRGSGGVRIEGTFEGDMQIRGMIVVGETGRVTCMNMRANTIVVEGTVRGNITAEKLEIRSTGRVWGDVSVISFSTEDGAFRADIALCQHLDPVCKCYAVFNESGGVDEGRKKET